MQTLEFVHVSSSEIDGNNAAVAGSADRRRIRSLVMRDFRRKERERRRTTGNAIDGTSAGLGQDEKANDIAQDMPTTTRSQSVQLQSTVSAPLVWRHAFGLRLTEAWFPAGHRDSALRNIAYTYDTINAASMISVQDALSLLHAGSVARINHLLQEARKRYIPVIVLLRREVNKKSAEMPVARLGFLAMACLMCEVGSPQSVDLMLSTISVIGCPTHRSCQHRQQPCADVL
jgi:hypothetical protein